MKKRSILVNSLAGAGLLIFSFTAPAQERPRDDDSYHTDRDARFHDEHWRGQLFERVDGDYFTILGLPLMETLDFLRRRGCLAQ